MSRARSWNGSRPSRDGYVFQFPVDLVRRCKYERDGSLPRPRRLEKVEGAARIDLEVADRVDKARRHGDLRGEVEHEVGGRNGVVQLLHVADVGKQDLDPGSVTVP